MVGRNHRELQGDGPSPTALWSYPYQNGRKVVVLEARDTACTDFVFNGKVVGRRDTFIDRYLGFKFMLPKA